MSDNNKTLDIYTAVSICEGFDGIEHSEDEWLAAYQYLVDTGAVWQLQGRFGRTAAQLIREGKITPPGDNQNE